MEPFRQDKKWEFVFRKHSDLSIWVQDVLAGNFVFLVILQIWEFNQIEGKIVNITNSNSPGMRCSIKL